MNAENVNQLRQLHKAENPLSETDFIKAQFKVIDNLQQALNSLKESFELEKACKNQVYYFILSNGLFNDFKAYAENNPLS